MKRTLILFTALVFLCMGSATAGNAGLFDYDPIAVENEMIQLEALEDFVKANPGVTLDQMIRSENPLASMVNQPYGVTDFNLTNDKALGIPGFIWGCCLSWVGILVVYLVADDPKETRSAIIGCVVNALLSGGSAGASFILQSRYYY